MIDKHDTKTMELDGIGKKRGRKPTGEALTAAQRKRNQRKRYDDLVMEAYCHRAEWTKALCLHALTTSDPVMKKYQGAAYHALERFILN